MADPNLRLLVLYDANSTYTSTVLEHLQAFSLFSAHSVYYAPAVLGAQCGVDLAAFDVVVLHYSVRLCYEDFISASYASAVAAFKGLKVLFIQDEYEYTETARRWIERLGIDVVYTCVPPEWIDTVYPRKRYPKVEFITNLTGYVPVRFERLGPRRPIAERRVVIGYRGRPLPYWYGALSREKLVIGQRMKKICEERGIPADIAWEETSRIYGDAWYEFIRSCKATLGTESGSNVFDYDGEIRRNIKAAFELDPGLTFEEAHARYVATHEGPVQMNQISPRVFEAIALGTALVLFRGEYSGIVKPDVHYIPLEKDFSNVDEVLAKLKDDALLQAMVDRAYDDVIGSGKYTYKAWIAGVDEMLARRATRTRTLDPFTIVLGTQTVAGDQLQIARVKRDEQLGGLVSSAPLLSKDATRKVDEAMTARRELARALWHAIPRRARVVIRPALPILRPLLKR